MSFKEFRLDAKSAGAQALDGLWGPGPPGDLLYDVSAKGRGRGNHGTRVGAGNVWTSSERGIVSQFNGVDDAWNCERALGIDNYAFTLMAWVWLDSTVLSTTASVLGIGDLGADELQYRVQNSHAAGARLRVFGNAGTINVDSVGGSFHGVKESWVHVAVSRIRSGAANIYQNGLLMGTDATAGANLNTVKVLQIGCADSAAISWWKGMIDDVRYYSRTLSIAEITHIYRTTRWTPYADIALGRIRRHGRHQRGHVRRAKP